MTCNMHLHSLHHILWNPILSVTGLCGKTDQASTLCREYVLVRIELVTKYLIRVQGSYSQRILRLKVDPNLLISGEPP